MRRPEIDLYLVRWTTRIHPNSRPNSATPEDVRSLRSKLAAVITIDLETEALQVCHPSFLDFVASEARSQEFWTEPGGAGYDYG
jgi:hypothetical protein